MATSKEAREKDLRAFQKDSDKGREFHRPAQHEAVVEATGPQGGENVKPIELFTADNSVYLDTHGQKRLDQTQLMVLRQELDAAFQAVS